VLGLPPFFSHPYLPFSSSPDESQVGYWVVILPDLQLVDVSLEFILPSFGIRFSFPMFRWRSVLFLRLQFLSPLPVVLQISFPDLRFNFVVPVLSLFIISVSFLPASFFLLWVWCVWVSSDVNSRRPGSPHRYCPKFQYADEYVNASVFPQPPVLGPAWIFFCPQYSRSWDLLLCSTGFFFLYARIRLKRDSQGSVFGRRFLIWVFLGDALSFLSDWHSTFFLFSRARVADMTSSLFLISSGPRTL